jgi:hypothetical protein
MLDLVSCWCVRMYRCLAVHYSRIVTLITGFCELHAALARMVDSAELSRFVPRRESEVPSEEESTVAVLRDPEVLSIVQSSSSLVMELVQRRLGATIAAFATRVAGDTRVGDTKVRTCGRSGCTAQVSVVISVIG